jgi:predicted RNA binding protein YcfA (HicA-like mRNA interferase family)
VASGFPSIKARRLLAVLMREPLSYEIVRQRGSHRLLKAPGRPRLVFAFHDRQELSPGHVRHVLVHQVGLEEREARDLL